MESARGENKRSPELPKAFLVPFASHQCCLVGFLKVYFLNNSRHFDWDKSDELPGHSKTLILCYVKNFETNFDSCAGAPSCMKWSH